MTRILLGNTGRGGEQAVFSAVVQAYLDYSPNPEVTVAVCPEFFQLWNTNIRVRLLGLDHEDPNGDFYLDPVGRWFSLSQSMRDQFDIIEFACEFGLDVPSGRAANPMFENIWSTINDPPCGMDRVKRRPSFQPSDEEWVQAEKILNTYGEDLVVISPVSTTVAPVLTQDQFKVIADRLGRNRPVASTGRLNLKSRSNPKAPIATDPLIPGTIDLRGISFLTLYGVSQRLGAFIGPDTATSWIVSGMPGKLMTVRGDAQFPIENTGLVRNGFREPSTTLELDVVGRPFEEILDACAKFFG